MLEKTENYKDLRILEVNIIRQVKMKKKNKKRVPQKNEKVSQNQALQ